MHAYRKIRDFHGSRAKGVGASDIPTLALLNLRYDQTPHKLWLVKTGREAPWPGNEATWWGRQLEGLVLKQYVSNPERFGSEFAEQFYREYLRRRSSGPLKVYTEFWHPEHHFALCHPDLLIENGDPLIVQAKSHSYFAAKRKADPDYGYDPDDRSHNGVPGGVFLQEQWELFCTGLSEAQVAVLANTNQYGEWGPIIADPRTQEKCLALAERFMWHVDHDEPPKPETWVDVQAMFPQIQPTTAMVSGDIELEVRRMIGRKERLDRAAKRIKAELADLKNAVGLLIGGNAVLSTAEGEVLATCKETGRWYLHETKKLEQVHPRIFKRLMDEGYITRSEWRKLDY